MGGQNAPDRVGSESPAGAASPASPTPQAAGLRRGSSATQHPAIDTDPPPPGAFRPQDGFGVQDRPGFNHLKRVSRSES